MAGIPKVKITFDADFDDLKKGLKGGQDEIEGFAGRMGEFGKKAAAAFAVAAAAAAAYAIKIGVDGVKAAIEDEQSQSKLALALENATGATKAQIDATESQILKMSLATGVADDKLRPALSRLAISTGDISKAQDLLALSLDISTQTGKPLEGVANALGKAFDGNTAALGKLGIGLSSAELKTMSFNDVQTKLSDLFGGAAARNADTFQGRMDILKTTLNEAKETIGYALLPILEKLVGYFTQYVVPVVEKISDAFSTKKGGLGAEITSLGDTLKDTFTPIWNGLVKAFGFVSDAIKDNIDKFKSFWEVVKYIAPLVGKILGEAFSVIGDVAASLIDVFGTVLGAIKPILNFIIDRLNDIIKVINFFKTGADIPQIAKIGSSAGFATGGAPGAISSGGSSTPKVVIPGGSIGGSVGGGSSSSAMGAGVASAVAGVVMVAAGGGFTDSQNAARLAAMGGGGFTDSQNAARINLTVNGAIDAEGTARTIINVLNDSFYRGTGGAGALQAI